MIKREIIDEVIEKIEKQENRVAKRLVEIRFDNGMCLSYLSDIETSIKSYVQECMTRFVMGDKPFSEWDSYVKELEDMGLAQYLEIKQGAYDRMNNTK